MQPKEDDISAIRKLQQDIASLDFEEDDLIREHKNIYTHIQQTIIEPKSSVLPFVPPVDILVYTAKSILFPTFIVELTPHLLDVLATLEFLRQRTISHAKTVLADKPKNGLVGAESYLMKQVADEQSWREVYITILCQCCHHDLYNHWTGDPPSMGIFMIRFNEYFPFLNRHCTHPSPRLFHQTLSTVEKQKLGKTGLAICELGSSSAQWITETMKDHPYWSLFQTERFRKRFPPSCPKKDLVKLTCKYLDYVALMVPKIDKITG